MHLKTVFVRFYKSFNFDYLRKYDSKVQTQEEWEKVDGAFWYPYVRIPIDERITTVVGANESGKTHLLTAIEKGLSGDDIARGDFCRYSQFFAVEQGKMRWPDFGFEWAGLTRDDREAVVAACGVEQHTAFDHFLLFRTERTQITVYLPMSTGYFAYPIQEPENLLKRLPSVFRLRENVALPESVPIRFLADEEQTPDGLDTLPRQRRVSLLDTICSHFDWFESKETVTKSAGNIAAALVRQRGLGSRDPASLFDNSFRHRCLRELEHGCDANRSATGQYPTGTAILR